MGTSWSVCVTDWGCVRSVGDLGILQLLVEFIDSSGYWILIIERQPCCVTIAPFGDERQPWPDEKVTIEMVKIIGSCRLVKSFFELFLVSGCSMLQVVAIEC